MAVQLLLREVVECQKAGEASCLATDGVATGFAPCRANAYLCRAASLPAPVAKQCEQSLFLVRLNRSCVVGRAVKTLPYSADFVTPEVLFLAKKFPLRE